MRDEMNNCYEDILQLTEREPIWFDEYAVPRFCEFSPKAIANIYADECALVLIQCQECHTEFQVAFSESKVNIHKLLIQKALGRKMGTLAESIRSHAIHYGDPPNIGCCGAGATMNCDDIKVLQYFRRSRFDWKRDKRLEIDLISK
jgi:hypothetical protein